MYYDLNQLVSYLTNGFNEEKNLARVCDVSDIEDAQLANKVIVRFDVERAVRHQAECAKRLADNNVFATMYFQTRQGAYDKELMTEIQDAGHEIGYHHECLDRCGGNFQQARDLFLREVEKFRQDGFDLKTVCAHGEAGLPKTHYSSDLDLFVKYPELPAEAGVTEAYHWIENYSPLHASDTLSGYKNFWPTIRQANDTTDPLLILAHLHRWHETPIGTALEVGKDVGRQLQNRVLKKRNYKIAR